MECLAFPRALLFRERIHGSSNSPGCAVYVSDDYLLSTALGASGLLAQTPAAQDVLAVVRQFQAAGIRGDKAALTQIFDPGVTHFHPGSPYRFVRRDRLVQEFEVASKNQQDMPFPNG